MDNIEESTGDDFLCHVHGASEEDIYTDGGPTSTVDDVRDWMSEDEEDTDYTINYQDSSDEDDS
jgi:hypothetical protein